MSLAAAPLPDDRHPTVEEVAVRLLEIDGRSLGDTHQLAEAWIDLHHCDSEVLDALDPAARREYLTVVNGPRRPVPVRSWSNRSALRIGASHLHVAVHRRLVVLQDR